MVDQTSSAVSGNLSARKVVIMSAKMGMCQQVGEIIAVFMLDHIAHIVTTGPNIMTNY